MKLLLFKLYFQPPSNLASRFEHQQSISAIITALHTFIHTLCTAQQVQFHVEWLHSLEVFLRAHPSICVENLQPAQD